MYKKQKDFHLAINCMAIIVAYIYCVAANKRSSSNFRQVSECTFDSCLAAVKTSRLIDFRVRKVNNGTLPKHCEMYVELAQLPLR